jgi:regulator of nucleoside diphosphate kinase
MTEPLITESDFKILKRLITEKNDKYCATLGKEITKARIVDDEAISPDIIRLNSYVEVQDLSSTQKLKLKIVMPDEVDIKSRCISVFAPISVVLIGQKENDVLSWQTTDGDRNLRILKVHNP